MPPRVNQNFRQQVDVRSPSQTHGQNPFDGLWQNTIDTFKNGIKRVFPGGPEVGEYGIEPFSVVQVPYAADAVPEPHPVGRPPQTTDSIGAAGTAIYSGFVTDLGEYKSSLMGNNAFPTYEQMRRSDPDVHAGLMACKLPVRAAQYQIIPGATPADPNHKFALEIAKFVEENLFGGLETMTSTGYYQTQSFEKVIENALLMLDFGCSCDEILWHVDGDKVRVRRLAPRLPITYFRYWPDSDGETLLALEQYGYRGDEYVNVVLPAEKVDYYVQDQEGADYFGFSLLRYAYQAWYFKTRLYAIDGIALERNAMGVPVITLGDGYSKEDRKYATSFVTKYSGHENTGLVIPETWKFGIEGTKGRLRDPKTSIQHYSEQILRSMLAGFLAFGTTQSGSRSLGGDMIGFFKMSLNALARNIATTMTNNIIRRLVDYNFGDSRKAVPYPSMSFSNIVAIDPLELADKIRNLAQWQVDIVQPSDELENWFLKEFGMPLKTVTRPRTMPVQERETIQETLAPEQAEAQAVAQAEGKVDKSALSAPPVEPVHPNDGKKAQEPSNKKYDPGVESNPHRTTIDDEEGRPNQKKVVATDRLLGSDQIDSIIGALELLSDNSKDKRSITCDFDGVINIEQDNQHVHKPNEFGVVSQNAIALLTRLHDAGFKIIITTARKNLLPVYDFLTTNHVPFDDLGNKKEPALAYIDDRGLHVDWGQDYDPQKVQEVFNRLSAIAQQHNEPVDGLV